jgi:hypothetical protein
MFDFKKDKAQRQQSKQSSTQQSIQGKINDSSHFLKVYTSKKESARDKPTLQNYSSSQNASHSTVGMSATPSQSNDSITQTVDSDKVPSIGDQYGGNNTPKLQNSERAELEQELEL